MASRVLLPLLPVLAFSEQQYLVFRLVHASVTAPHPHLWPQVQSVALPVPLAHSENESAAALFFTQSLFPKWAGCVRQQST